LQGQWALKISDFSLVRRARTAQACKGLASALRIQQARSPKWGEINRTTKKEPMARRSNDFGALALLAVEIGEPDISRLIVNNAVV